MDTVRIKAAELTTQIVVAAMARNNFSPSQLTSLITDVQSTMMTVVADTTPSQPPAEPLVPAVNPKKSITADYIICLEDGQRYKSLKRHIQTSYGLTPDAYRTKWGLPADYPMTAPGYAATRSSLAKAMGLGKKRSHAVR